MSESAPPGAPAPQPRPPREADDSSQPGRALIQAVYAASRLGALWGYESKLTSEALANLAAAANRAAGSHGEAVLRITPDVAFLHDHRIRIDFAGYGSLRHIQERSARTGIGELRIANGAPAKDLIELLRVFEGRLDDMPEDERYEHSQAALARTGVRTVAIGPPCIADSRKGRIGPQDVKQAALQAYFRLLFQARAATSADPGSRKANPRKLKRAVHEAIDVLERGESVILALLQVRNYHGFAANHAANCAVLSMAMALRIGMHKRLVADLGLAALVHETIAPGTEPADDAVRADRTARSARLLLTELGFGPTGIRAVAAARDLHAPRRAPDPPPAAVADLSGPDPASAPATPEPTPAANTGDPIVLSILRAVCAYDTLTSPAQSADGPCSLHSSREVLRLMCRDPGACFDPDVVRLLRAVVGFLPVGTVVQLETGEKATVETRARSAMSTRPTVRIFASAAGESLDEQQVVDLEATDPETNAPLRSVTRMAPPHVAFGEVGEYLRALGM